MGRLPAFGYPRSTLQDRAVGGQPSQSGPLQSNELPHCAKSIEWPAGWPPAPGASSPAEHNLVTAGARPAPFSKPGRWSSNRAIVLIP